MRGATAQKNLGRQKRMLLDGSAGYFVVSKALIP